MLDNLENTVADFWEWFVKNESEVKALFSVSTNSEFVGKLSENVKVMHPALGWELGPGDKGNLFFSLSPNGNRDLLSLTHSIVEASPKLDGWMFWAAKPRKKWKRRMEITRSNESLTVDFRNWYYSITAYQNREFFDIRFTPEFIDGLNVADYKKLGELYVESELGEEIFLDKVAEVEVDFDEAISERDTKAEYLYEHIMSLVSSS